MTAFDKIIKSDTIQFKGRFTLARTVRANCSREQFASFALSNAIRANNLRIKLIFDEYFT